MVKKGEWLYNRVSETTEKNHKICMLPDYLVIGHITRDVSHGREMTGGCVYYGAVTAQRLGLSVAIVTSCPKDFDFPEDIKNIEIETIPSPDVTTFLNDYTTTPDCSDRKQTIISTAKNIFIDDIPDSWRSIPFVHFGPLVNELGPDVVQGFPDSFKVASIQGWARKWDSKGKVSTYAWDGSNILPHVNAAVCSKEDIYSEECLTRWKEMVPLLIVTDGQRGSRSYFEGKYIDVDAVVTKEVDPTGAGDVFAASFIVKYRETSDYEIAAKFASWAAGGSVGGYGVSTVPTNDHDGFY